MSFNEVQEKVLQLESAIKRLDTVKKHLNRNASDVSIYHFMVIFTVFDCLSAQKRG